MEKQEFPQIMHICAVAPGIIGIRIRDGRVLAGTKVPYEKAAGDTVEVTDYGQHWVKRGGGYLGCLNGKEHDSVFLNEKAEVDPLDETLIDKPESYGVISNTDINFAEEKTPRRVYRKSKPADLARTGPFIFEKVTDHFIYLSLEHPLDKGMEYRVIFKDRKLGDREFVFDPDNIRSEAVHVSHLGFRPDDPVKTAFLSCWMGTGGGVDYRRVTKFHVVNNETGDRVFTGQPQKALGYADPEDAQDLNYTKADVYHLDFPNLSAPGEYRIVVPGVGSSYPFRIDGDAWKEPFRTAARGFYHQRSGIALGPPHTEYVRPRIFHPDDGVQVNASKAALMDTGNGLNREDDNFGNLVKGRTKRAVKNAWGSYCDAGDWDRRIQHLTSSRDLLDLAMMFPEKIGKLDLNIPESADKEPDVVGEALFNIDGYRRMQTREGGIRGGIESAEHPIHGEASWEESQDVLAYEPGVWSSYIYAAVAAKAATCLTMFKNAKKAKVYEKSALAAMTWAEKALADGQGRSYQMQVTNNRHWAAAELFRLTGDETWHKLFDKTFISDLPASSKKGWSTARKDGAWAYLHTDENKVKNRMYEQCHDLIVREAELLLRTGQKTGFGWIKPPLAHATRVFAAPMYCADLVRAHRLTKNDRYLMGLVLACQMGAGGNPVNICYTTGLGHDYPHHPLHVDARVKWQVPPPGLTVFGPVYTESGDQGWGTWAHDMIEPLCFPSSREWPAAESYWDVFWNPPVCEFTVQSPMTQVAYAWGYLMAR